jgi:Flp pilus assembly pilin Flp
MGLFHRLKSKRGQGFVEYIFIIGLIALLIFLIVKAFGTTVGAAFTKAGKKVTEAVSW